MRGGVPSLLQAREAHDFGGIHFGLFERLERLSASGNRPASSVLVTRPHGLKCEFGRRVRF